MFQHVARLWEIFQNARSVKEIFQHFLNIISCTCSVWANTMNIFVWRKEQKACLLKTYLKWKSKGKCWSHQQLPLLCFSVQRNVSAVFTKIVQVPLIPVHIDPSFQLHKVLISSIRVTISDNYMMSWTRYNEKFI